MWFNNHKQYDTQAQSRADNVQIEAEIAAKRAEDLNAARALKAAQRAEKKRLKAEKKAAKK